MTLPGEPKIRINPSEAERATLPEWLEVEERDGDIVNVLHIKPHDPICSLYGALKLHRRDACTLADHIGAYLWKPGDEKDTANRADDGEADSVGVVMDESGARQENEKMARFESDRPAGSVEP